MADNFDVKDILRKYSSKIEKNIKTDPTRNVNYSREYLTFKEEMAPELGRYEKWCHSLGSIVKLNPSKKDTDKIKRHIEVAHLEIEPWQATTLAVFSFLAVFFIGVLISVSVVLISGNLASFPVLFFILMTFASLFVFYFTSGYPQRLANKWRLKASSQMVPAVLYTVVYMRHTSNLEKAISFTADNLQYPLALDFKKVFYDVEVGKFSSIKESLDNYLETWRDYAPGFIEAFHLIEGSLFEPSNERRIDSLEKSLQVILESVQDKMIKFTHNVRSPITNVYMLGVVLPTLMLSLLPLASAMLGGAIKWFHVIILFNLIVPFFVFYLTDKVLLLRPGGHGETSLLARNPHYYKYKSNKPFLIAFLITFPLMLISLLPLIFHFTPIPDWIGIQNDFTLSQIGFGFLGGNEQFFDFRSNGLGGTSGPFGIGALILSLFFPLSISLFFSISYGMKTKDLIKERNNTLSLEREFNNSLFQIGNRLGNGVPPELVFGKVAESARGLKTEDFFRKVSYNIHRAGMSVEKAIFDPRRGALIYYPSELIATSMKILIESSKKGLKVAAVSLISISEYIKNIEKITLRLKDLLAEIVSDMKSNMTFLAPLLSGIVVGLAAMITAILNKLDFANLAADGGASLVGGFGSLLQLFSITDMIPPYYLQIAISVYIIQVIFILTNTLVVIDSGEDELTRVNKIGKNLSRGITLYVIVAFISIFSMYLLSSIVLSGFS